MPFRLIESAWRHAPVYVDGKCEWHRKREAIRAARRVYRGYADPKLEITLVQTTFRKLRKEELDP
jgi:hypothetical protein